MGLYDYIKCEVPLPDGFQGTLQTKDLCCEMVTHTITKNGRLICERIDSTELLPKAERDYPDAPDGSLRSWIGSIRTHTSQYDANFHGILNFYGCEGKGLKPPPRASYWMGVLCLSSVLQLVRARLPIASGFRPFQIHPLD